MTDKQKKKDLVKRAMRLVAKWPKWKRYYLLTKYSKPHPDDK